MLCLKMPAEVDKEATTEMTEIPRFSVIRVRGTWEDLGNRASESTGNNL